jgi:lipid A 3-O-deacylase
MLKTRRLFFAMVIGILCAPAAQAVELTAAVGLTEHKGSTWRIGLSQGWGARWLQSGRGYVGGYWEGAYTQWCSKNGKLGARTVSFSPVLLYRFERVSWQPFIEAGIGVSLFSKTQVCCRRLGSAFNFEDRLGVGLVLSGGAQLGLRAIHYSNARIKMPNEGINSFSLFYRHPL